MKAYRILGLGIVLLPGLMTPAHAEDSLSPQPTHALSAEMKKLVSIIRPVGDGNVRGSVVFEKGDDGIIVTARIGGLTPLASHAIHIHEFGDLGSDDATSAGDHFNPRGHPHAVPDDNERHAGDLGNLQADGDGNATLTLVVNNITLDAGKSGILGRAVIVHSKADDGGQPSGNAGNRIAAGVIGISKDGKQQTTSQPPTAKPPVPQDNPEKKETRPTTPDSDETVKE